MCCVEAVYAEVVESHLEVDRLEVDEEPTVDHDANRHIRSDSLNIVHGYAS